jgi:hypothetical protein
MTTATQGQIVHTFLEAQALRTVNLDSAWDVTEATYINGIPLHVDHDYYQGWLVEVVERESSVVSYVAIAAFHGPRLLECDCGGVDVLVNGKPCDLCGGVGKWFDKWDHDSVMYEPNCGTFFDRTEPADAVTVGQWAVSVIYGMMEAYADSKRAYLPRGARKRPLGEGGQAT